MRMRLLCAGTAVAVLLGGTAACKSDGAEAGDGSTIKIGLIAERAGLYAPYGEILYAASKLAVRQVNDKGGVTVDGSKRKLSLEVCEDKSQQSLVAQCATRLIRDEKVKFMFGALGQFAPTARSFTESAKAIYFTSSDSAGALLDKSQRMVLTVPAIPLRVKMGVAALNSVLPKTATGRRGAFIGDDEATTKAVVPIVNSAFEAQNITSVATQRVSLDSTSYASAVSALNANRPDLLFTFPSNPTRLSTMLSQLRQLSVGKAILGYSDGCSGVKVNPNQVYIGDPLANGNVQNPRTTAAKAFVSAYRKQSPSTASSPVLYAALWAYDYFFMLAKAITAAGTADDTGKIMKSLKGTTYSGIGGKIRIDDDGSSLVNQAMCVVRGSSAPQWVTVSPSLKVSDGA